MEKAAGHAIGNHTWDHRDLTRLRHLRNPSRKWSAEVVELGRPPGDATLHASLPAAPQTLQSDLAESVIARQTSAVGCRHK